MAIKNFSIGFVKVGSIKLGTPKTANAPGRNINGFRLVSQDMDALNEANSILGVQPKELRIHFPRIPHITEEKALAYVYDDAYAYYKNSMLFCRGDGETATRAVRRGVQETVNCTCEFAQGDKPLCKPRGYMRVVISNLQPRGVWVLGTNSWNSISNMRSVVEMYHTMLGNKFWQTQFILYKEEMIIQGRTQYITKLKIAPEFLQNMPSGAEAFSMNLINFDDEEQEEDNSVISEQKTEEAPTGQKQPEPAVEQSGSHESRHPADNTRTPEQPATVPAPKAVVKEVPVEVVSSPAVEPEKAVVAAVVDEKPASAPKSGIRRAKETNIAATVSEIQRLRGDNSNQSDILKVYTGFNSIDDIPDSAISKAMVDLAAGKKDLVQNTPPPATAKPIQTPSRETHFSSNDLLTDDDIPF